MWEAHAECMCEKVVVGRGGGGVEGICCSVTAYKGQETTGYESGSKPSGLFSFVLFHLIVESH